jgi:hypothetical protein
MNFYEFYARLCGQHNIKYKQLAKPAALMHPDEVLCTMSVVEYSYRIVNCKNI